ncbi:MAG: hypothetical protein AAFU77_00860 [Myxococcota bacterium]
MVQLVGLVGVLILRASPGMPLLVALACGLAAGTLLPRTRTPAVLLAALLLFALAFTKSITSATLDGQLSLVSSGVRMLLPVAVLLWAADRRREARGCLRIGISLTFIGHGIEALVLTPSFVELIHSTSIRWLGGAPSMAAMGSALTAIGIIDITVGVLVAAFGVRTALMYMVAWGFITALSRVTAHGLGAWPEFAFRAAHWAAPLFLLRSDGGIRE